MEMRRVGFLGPRTGLRVVNSAYGAFGVMISDLVMLKTEVGQQINVVTGSDDGG